MNNSQWIYLIYFGFLYAGMILLYIMIARKLQLTDVPSLRSSHKDVTITGPDIAENGAVVPVGCATTLAGAKKLMILVEKNPNMLCALFDLTDGVEPNFTTRVKMGQSSDVYAVAITADNKVLFARKEIKVTLGGCGG